MLLELPTVTQPHAVNSPNCVSIWNGSKRSLVVRKMIIVVEDALIYIF